VTHSHGHVGVISLLALGSALLTASCASAAPAGEEFLTSVRTFADNVLAHGKDVYGPKHTPLFVDGVNVDTHEPATWLSVDDEAWVMSNLASQQNLLRVLVGLTNLTGDEKYKRAAIEALGYAFANLQHEDGLLDWGGHRFYDAASEKAVGEGYRHELKSHYPFYELMWEVSPSATRRFLREFWNAHILQWDILDMNRHGAYEAPRGDLWDSEYVGGPVPFIGKGLTFMNTGSDLFYAGAWLSKLSGDREALVWGKRLARRYVEVRSPKTGIGGTQYSRIEKDRGIAQFGPEFGERLMDPTILDAGKSGSRYGTVALCQLRLGELLGDDGKEFLQWAHEDLTAYGKWAYDESDNSLWPMISDGTRLKPEDVKRDGYYSASALAKFRAGLKLFCAYAIAYRLTGDPFMWQMARGIARGNGLGEMAEKPGTPGDLAPDTSSADLYALFGLLELHRATGDATFLDTAERIAHNRLSAEFHHGFFVSSPDHLFAKFDSLTPLALLHLVATQRGTPAAVPTYYGGGGYFHCPHKGLGRTYDSQAIYARKRQ
jgi:pectate lyase